MLPGGTVVNPGDELALGYSSIVQVKHVTPTGQIVLTDGQRYDRTGQKIGVGRDREYFHIPELSLLTDELRAEIAAKIAAEIARKSCIAYLKHLFWENFDDATLAQVVEMLKKAEQQMEQQMEELDKVLDEELDEELAMSLDPDSLMSP
jgi:hypothetical protein